MSITALVVKADLESSFPLIITNELQTIMHQLVLNIIFSNDATYWDMLNWCSFDFISSFEKIFNANLVHP